MLRPGRGRQFRRRQGGGKHGDGDIGYISYVYIYIILYIYIYLQLDIMGYIGIFIYIGIYWDVSYIYIYMVPPPSQGFITLP